MNWRGLGAFLVWFSPCLIGWGITAAIVAALLAIDYLFTAMLVIIPLGIASAISPIFFEHWLAERRHARFMASHGNDETPRH